MAQHLLIADLAAPLLLVGLRSPVYAFLLPRPVLVPLARRRRLRRAFRTLRRPLVAIPVFVRVLYGWHLAFMFEAALRNDAVHVLQHWSFVFASVLVWWAPLDPKRRRLHGELWKIGHLIGARLAGHVPRDGVRDHAHAGLRRLRRLGARARAVAARRPAARGRR